MVPVEYDGREGSLFELVVRLRGVAGPDGSIGGEDFINGAGGRVGLSGMGGTEIVGFRELVVVIVFKDELVGVIEVGTYSGSVDSGNRDEIGKVEDFKTTASVVFV